MFRLLGFLVIFVVYSTQISSCSPLPNPQKLDLATTSQSPVTQSTQKPPTTQSLANEPTKPSPTPRESVAKAITAPIPTRITPPRSNFPQRQDFVTRPSIGAGSTEKPDATKETSTFRPPRESIAKAITAAQKIPVTSSPGNPALFEDQNSKDSSTSSPTTSRDSTTGAFLQAKVTSRDLRVVPATASPARPPNVRA